MQGDFTVTFELNRVPRKLATPDHEQWTFGDLKDGFLDHTRSQTLSSESRGLLDSAFSHHLDRSGGGII